MDAPQWPEAPRPLADPLATFQPGVPARDSPMAVASLASGILCWFVLPIIGAVIAVITGAAARREIRASNGAVGGWNLATIGFWLGVIHLGLIALAFVTVVGLLIAGVSLAALFSH